MLTIERLRIILVKAEKVFIIASLATMLFVVILQVFVRSVLNFSFSWPEEVSRYLFIYTILIGSALGVEKGMHFKVSFLIDNYLPPGAKKVVSLIVNISVATFTVVFLYYGILLAIDLSFEKTPALMIPIVIILSAIPISAFLILVHLGLKVILKNYDSTGRE